MNNQYILTWQCPDSSGVLAKVTQALFEHGAFITETSQYSDPYTDTFFSRIAFDDRQLKVPMEEFTDALEALAKPLQLHYQLRNAAQLPKVVIAVSKDEHCLVSLLTKWRAGVLPIDIVAVVSNHQKCEAICQFHELPYHYLPIADDKVAQEQQLLAVFEQYQGDLLVLARYMQILSDQLCTRLAGKAINIHHSFYPVSRALGHIIKRINVALKLLAQPRIMSRPISMKGQSLCKK